MLATFRLLDKRLHFKWGSDALQYPLDAHGLRMCLLAIERDGHEVAVALSQPTHRSGIKIPALTPPRARNVEEVEIGAAIPKELPLSVELVGLTSEPADFDVTAKDGRLELIHKVHKQLKLTLAANALSTNIGNAGKLKLVTEAGIDPSGWQWSKLSAYSRKSESHLLNDGKLPLVVGQRNSWVDQCITELEARSADLQRQMSDVQGKIKTANDQHAPPAVVNGLNAHLTELTGERKLLEADLQGKRVFWKSTKDVLNPKLDTMIKFTVFALVDGKRVDVVIPIPPTDK